jgi:hypothetical protein
MFGIPIFFRENFGFSQNLTLSYVFIFCCQYTFFPQLSFSLDVSSQIVMYLEESFVICEYVVMEKHDENCLVPSENIL